MPVDYHAWTHRPKALGGTDPIEFDSAAYAYLDWGAGGAVTVNTLFNPISIAAYDEGFRVEPDGASFELDVDLGIIQWNNPGEYLVTGWVQFDGGSTAGSVLGGALDFGNSGSFSTFRVGNSIVSNAINDTMRIPLTSPVFSFNPGVFGHDSVRVLVHHDDAGGQDLASIRLHVIRLSGTVAGEFYIPS